MTLEVPELKTRMVRFSVVAAATSIVVNETLTRSGWSLSYAMAGVARALDASTRPAPTRLGLARTRVVTVVGLVKTSWVAVFITSALSCAGVQVGCSCLSRAITPAVSGAAIEVPLKLALPEPLPMPVEMTFTPGAATSGLSRALFRQRAGPRAVKVAASSNSVGSTSTIESSMVTPTALFNASWPAMALPSLQVSERDGMVSVPSRAMFGGASVSLFIA